LDGAALYSPAGQAGRSPSRVARTRGVAARWHQRTQRARGRARLIRRKRQDAAARLAIAALCFIASDPEQLGRFPSRSAASVLSPSVMRRASPGSSSVCSIIWPATRGLLGGLRQPERHRPGGRDAGAREALAGPPLRLTVPQPAAFRSNDRMSGPTSSASHTRPPALERGLRSRRADDRLRQCNELVVDVLVAHRIVGMAERVFRPRPCDGCRHWLWRTTRSAMSGSSASIASSTVTLIMAISGRSVGSNTLASANEGQP